MRENLEDAIHEARVAEVDQPPHTRARGRMVAHPPTEKPPVWEVPVVGILKYVPSCARQGAGTPNLSPMVSR